MRSKHVAIAAGLTLCAISRAEAASLTFSPDPLDFGQVQVGDTVASRTASLTYRRDYDDTLVFFQTASEDASAFTFDTSDCEGPFVCSVKVTLHTSISGNFSENLNVIAAEYGAPNPDHISFASTSLNARAIVTEATMSPVPLPASAPMFGAALFLVGAVGHGMKRMGQAAV